MLLMLVLAAGIGWWMITEAATDTPPPTPTAVAVRPGDISPPDELGDGEVWLGAMDLASELILLPDATLRDVDATGQGVHSGPHGLSVEFLEVDATVPFEEIAGQLGDDSVVRATDDGQVSVERTVEFLGRQIGVVATGTVEVVSGRIKVEPTSIDVGLSEFISEALATLVDRFVTIEHEVAGLPENLELLDVAVLDDGIRASLAGDDVVLAEGRS